jgi:hypothetical protein
MESPKGELILASSSLALSSFERRLEICNSALQLSSKQAVIFLNRFPSFARKLVAHYYPLDNDFIIKHYPRLSLNRILLVKNSNIRWDINLIEALGKENFCWRIFGQPFADYGAPSAEWSFSFISHFADYLNWEFMSDNPYIAWDEGMLDYFSDKIDWARLSYNERLPLSSAFIKKYFDKLDWKNLSLRAPLTEEIVCEHQKHIDWDRLSWNENFPWTLDFISQNEDRLNWDNLSLNQSLPWSFIFFVNFKKKLNLKYLSAIKNLPWSLNFIESHFDEWNWNDEHCLTTNSGLPWSEQFVLKYWDRWDLESLCRGYNCMTAWNVNLIERVLSESPDYWSDLESNDCLPWSIDLIENYSKYWTEPPLNQGVYEKVFASHINNDVLNNLFQ